jgi:NodT family efflux transporter outer membrane factor (OMF) lipoprotein
MSRKYAAVKRVRLFANALVLKARQALMPGDSDVIAKVIQFRRTELRTNSNCGAMAFAGMATGLVCNLLAACAVGPDFQEPPAPEVTGYTPKPLVHYTVSAESRGGAAQHFVQDLDIPGQWWEIFHSHAMNNLIEDALKHNPDVQAAQAGLRVGRETTEAQKGAFAPQIAGGYNSYTQKVSSVVSPPGNSPGPYLRLHTAQVDVSYTPDVFGLVRREVESEEALAAVQHFQVEATYLTLTSNVVAGAIQEASLRAQIAATKEIIAIETDLLRLLRVQKKLGQVAEADVALQEAALAQVQETLPPLEKQLAQQRDLLTALAGRYPSEEVAEKFTLESLRFPRELPVSLPSKLVEQRPDVQAASASLHSASALIGVAVANRLPVISLTANLSTSWTELAQLFTPPANAYLLTAAVAQPIFDGFTLYHKQKAAEAAYDQADAQYRSTVIMAFQNVADTLHAIEADARAFKAAVAAESAAKKSLDIVRNQAHLGQLNALAVLNAEQTYRQALVTRVQDEANRYADTAALFQALGGGWWNRNDVPPREPLDLADVLRVTAPMPK